MKRDSLGEMLSSVKFTPEAGRRAKKMIERALKNANKTIAELNKERAKVKDCFRR